MSIRNVYISAHKCSKMPPVSPALSVFELLYVAIVNCATVFIVFQTGMDFNAKRMKGVFKKYLQFEMDHGDEAGVEAVKAKATEYVASLAG